MKLFAGLLIAVSLMVGALAASTAYNPPLDAIDRDAPAPTLNGPAGRDPQDPERPLFDPAESPEPVRLTAARLERLEAAGAKRVRVREFAWWRWDGRYVFLASCLGLLAGAGLLRGTGRRAVSAGRSAQPGAADPEAALRAARERVAELIAARAEADPQRRQRVASALDDLRGTHQAAVEAGRAELVARLGLAGYARFMDRFAAAERQLHRAWSAAVDGVPEEAEDCLDAAVAALDEAIERLHEESA